MAVITYKCPGCGSALSFDPASGKYVCSHCESVYEEHELQTVQETPEEMGGAVIYACPNCGGEVVTDGTTAASLCYYCQSPVVLKGRLSGQWKPDGVLPFAVSREAAGQAFLKWAGKKRFTPKGFSAKSCIEKITGVYYPYWVSQVELEALFEGKGQNSTVASTPNKIITTTRHYRVMRRARMTFKNLVRPALQKQDRLLADGVQPYPMGKVRVFKESYLAGFQAERRDVEQQDLTEDLIREAQGYADTMIRPRGQYDTVTGKTSVSDVTTKSRYVLLPAWVVTYKAKNGKVSHYIINGQTERTCGVLPVDKGKMWMLGAGVCAAVTLLGCIGGYFVW